jgi:iron complex outermembrane receptor protein
MEMSYEDLLNLPFEDLIAFADIVGVSTDELLQMIFNKQLTTASKKQESSFDSPLSSSVITAEEIERSGATSIEDALRLVPGLIIREKTNGVYDLHIRGFDNLPADNFTQASDNSISLIMVDGMPVYNNVDGGTFWETLPVSLSQIDRIEVVRGASSALYGPNAASGVINIITKSPEAKKNTVQYSVKTGNYNSNIGSIYYGSRINNKLRATVSAGYDIRDKYSADRYSFNEGRYLPTSEQDSIVNITGSNYQGYKKETIANSRAKEVFNGNVNLFYDVSDDINFKIMGGLQDSKIQTIFFENLATPFSCRVSKTGFGDFQANVKGFTANISYQAGEQDLSQGMIRPVIHYDMSTINANVEYNYQIGKLIVRPGFNYQSASYDDSKYIQEIQAENPTKIIGGLFGKEQSSTLYAGSLRAEYTFFDKLRLIAAGRIDKYADLEKQYYSYQFVASYKVNDNNLLRAVYSRAYRGGFVADLHENFKNQIVTNQVKYIVPNVPTSVSYNQYYIGSCTAGTEMDLMSTDLIEIGWRSTLSKAVQIDIEAFSSYAKNFNAMVSSFDTSYVYYTNTELGLGSGNSALPKTITIDNPMTFQNIPLTAQQYGVSATVNIAFNKNFSTKIYGTYQETYIRHHITPDNDTVNRVHRNTPAFYGGFIATYLLNKWDFTTNAYCYTEQTYNHYWYSGSKDPNAETNAADQINAKFILNGRIAYKMTPTNKVFIEGKNLLFDKSNEFGFSDYTGSLFFVGVSMNF